MGGFNPKDYEGVDSRIHRFYQDHPNGRILTKIIEIYRDDNGRPIQYIVCARVFRNPVDLAQGTTVPVRMPDATGYAEETVSVSTAPKASLLETCETSAIGRALANLGYSPKGARASREEMEKVERYEEQEAAPRPIKKAGRPTNPTDDYVDSAMLKYRANSVTPDEKKQLLEAWPAKLAKPIPDRIPPSVARELEEVLDAITRGVKPAATDPDPCATCGLAPTCPLGAAGETDPQCRHYNPEGEEA
jgi:hypothetical protein